MADADRHATLGYRSSGRAHCNYLAPCWPQPRVDADRVHSAAQPDRLVGLRLQPLADRRSVIDLARVLWQERLPSWPLLLHLSSNLRERIQHSVHAARESDYFSTANILNRCRRAFSALPPPYRKNLDPRPPRTRLTFNDKAQVARVANVPAELASRFCTHLIGSRFHHP
jgi:hypothetical protein